MAAQPPQLELNLNSDGTIFPVKKSILLEHLRFFQEDASRLNAVEYRVKSKVPSDVFRNFVGFLQGNPIQVAERTFPFLRALSEEFGFEALSAECDSFKKSHERISDDSEAGQSFRLEARVAEVEERQLLLERSTGSAANELMRLPEKIAALERELTRLSSLCASLDGRLSKHVRHFEGEVDYRRGCEYLFGTNGYGLRGEELSKALGLRHLKSSADSGHSDAQFRYGICLLEGCDCAKDVSAAVEHLKRSTDSHNSFAEQRYGRCLNEGVGVGQDRESGIALFRRSADGGNARGQNALGFYLEHGIGIEKDLVRSSECYRLSAEQGNSVGQNNFGLCLEKGTGIEKNLIRAIEHYRLSAEQGHSHGEYNFGRCLVEGIGISGDRVRGAGFVRAAADRGNSSAQYLYAGYLENGTGVERDIAQAAHFYKLALDQGRSAAQSGYERCSRAMGN
jgi:TPR repeat protein